jgi:hypothetical protein
MAMTNDIHRYFDDVLPPPLEPRALMPAQFFTQRERRNARDGIRRLMYATLEDAVNVYTREAGSTRPSRTFQQARRWIDGSDRTWVFSFLRICEALDLDPEYIRRGVRAATRRCGRGRPREVTPRGVAHGRDSTVARGRGSAAA